MKQQISFLFATFFNSGRAPKAPGTFGSLATVPLAFVLAYFFGFWGIISGVIVSFFIGTAAVKEVLKSTPHDPSFVVIDEVAGQLLTFAGVASYLQNNSSSLLFYIIGFILFRIFDIFKPFPVSWADKKILNHWGVMLDDIIAGLYAGLILWGLHYFQFLI